MKSVILALVVTGLAFGSAVAGPDRRTQLEYAAGISAEEAGRYSAQQLSLIIFVMQKDRLSNGEKQARIRRIKAGKYIGLNLGPYVN